LHPRKKEVTGNLFSLNELHSQSQASHMPVYSGAEMVL